MNESFLSEIVDKVDSILEEELKRKKWDCYSVTNTKEEIRGLLSEFELKIRNELKFELLKECSMCKESAMNHILDKLWRE